jgi:hypothetical protein
MLPLLHGGAPGTMVRQMLGDTASLDQLSDEIQIIDTFVLEHSN